MQSYKSGATAATAQTAHPVSFCLPESFDPAAFLRSPRLAERADDARYFVGLILSKFARREVDECGLVRLKADYLRKVMHHRLAKPIVEALIDGGAVERAGGYVVGERAYGYRLGNRYLNDRHVRVRATDRTLIERILACRQWVEKERLARMQPVHLELEHRQRRLGIDTRAARDVLADLPTESNPFDSQGILVANIQRREFYLNVGQYGRVSNNITNLKRELRRTLRVDGEHLVNVDLRCAQPALVTAAARTKELEDGDTETGGEGRGKQGKRNTSIYDVHLFEQSKTFSITFPSYTRLTQGGTFYEFLATELAKRSVTMPRDELKKRFLADVIAKKKVGKRGAEYPSIVENVFRELFPDVYAFIRKFNSGGFHHENLIRELQRQESSFVIGIVAADLINRHPNLFILTLHDAIYTTPNGIQPVQSAFERGFEATGLHLAWKVGVN